MQQMLTGIQLAAYLACVHVTLKNAYQLYWHINDRARSSSASTTLRSVLAVFSASLPFVSALALTLAFAAAFSPRPLVALGLTVRKDALAFLGIGAAVGSAGVALAVIGGWLLGCFRVTPSRNGSGSSTDTPRLAASLTEFFTGAFFEEAIMRGWIFYVLSQMSGANAAIIGSSLFFALAHLTNGSKAPHMFTLNAFIFGLLAGLCRWYTGELWLPIGLHLGWNLTSCPILGLPHGGRDYDRGLMSTSVTGPQWLTGGSYSPDAGFLGTLALLAAAVGLRVLALV